MPSSCTHKRKRLNRRLFLAISLVLVWYKSKYYHVQPVNHYQYQNQPHKNNNNLVASGNKDSHHDHNDTDDDLVMVCGITAIFGTYEKTAKEPLEPLVPSFPLFLVTDQEHLLVPHSNSTVSSSSSAWTPIRVNSSLWQEDCTKEEYVGARNNPCEQPFPFNIAKFYKMQFYRVPELQEAGCNVVIWFDATIVIKHAAFMGRMADRANLGENFLVYVQDGPRRSWKDGLVSSEVKRVLGKYGGKQSSAFGPPQHVDDQYEYYLSQGFTEGWFRNTTWFNQYKGVGNDMKYGLYITCMFMIDLRKSESKQFLECWWRENILRSTQDQVGFPYCAWKLNTKIHALPDEKDPIGSWMENPYFRKLDHGL